MFYRTGVSACLLAFIVIVLGAYVRLSDAGLGCPDWPGCYGQITAPDEPHEIQRAIENFPSYKPGYQTGYQSSYQPGNQPGHHIDSAKAWKEMLHRYFASALGLLIILLVVFAWRHRQQVSQQLYLPAFLLLLVVFQGLLGMWTVTLLLKPSIVTLHLLMGLLTLSLLCWAMLKHQRPWYKQLKHRYASSNLRKWAKFGLLILVLQIFLGGWTSTNYAALFCSDFPQCQGQWWPALELTEAFRFVRPTGINYEGGVLTNQAGVTVHFMHRLGALLCFTLISALAISLLLMSETRLLRKLSVLILILVSIQAGLGIANVVFSLPLVIAVAHNAVAALLLLSLITLNYVLHESQYEFKGCSV